MKKSACVVSVLTALVVVLVGVLFLLQTSGCGSGGGCGGTTFVNESGETVIVSANTLSGIQFDTFTLADGASNKVCGNDTDDIMGDYEWPDGDTYSKGLTWSGGDFCIYLLTDHTATTGNCE